MALLEPDRYFARVTRISVRDDIVDAGFRHVLLDMDNTLVSRATGGIPRDVRVWLGELRDSGVAICLLSNNWHASPYKIAEELDLPLVAKALKPLPHSFILARGRIGARSATTVVIGDQLSTDVVGAHMLGMKAYLVCPLVEQDLKHTVVLRGLERALMGNRAPEGAGCLDYTLVPGGDMRAAGVGASGVRSAGALNAEEAARVLP